MPPGRLTFLTITVIMSLAIDGRVATPSFAYLLDFVVILYNGIVLSKIRLMICSYTMHVELTDV